MEKIQEKYSVVKKDDKYAIKIKYSGICKPHTKIFKGRFGQEISDKLFYKSDNHSEFILEKPKKKNPLVYTRYIGLKIKTFKSKESAQKYLKKYLWDNLVEPVIGESEWELQQK